MMGDRQNKSNFSVNQANCCSAHKTTIDNTHHMTTSKVDVHDYKNRFNPCIGGPQSIPIASISTDNRFVGSSPASDETSEAKEEAFSRGACFLLFGVSQWLREKKKMNREISDVDGKMGFIS